MTGAPGRLGIAIAVTGLAARLPGAPTLAAFRALVRSGDPAVRRFSPAELAKAGLDPGRIADPQFVPAKGHIDDADCFDYAFFGVSPALARATDPQHRLFLETCWHAMEDAGLAHEHDRRVGVFAGSSAASSYFHAYAARDPETARALDPFQVYIVNQPAALPNQASYHFDLTGPSVAVQTACSTGLAAVVSACQSLIDLQCDAAIAGAVTVSLPLIDGYVAPPGSILSPSGRCAPFAAEADGTLPGDGVAAVVLKRLDDAIADGDRIHAVIRGYGITNDGARKVAFSAPSADGQAAAIADALAMAEIEPAEIGFIETHGTGTALGDAIEIAALREAFAGCAPGSIALGATKSQIGHLDVAAGLAGFIKAVIAVEDGVIPPLRDSGRVNPALQLDASPFRIPAAASGWNGGARRAGVSSFGMGGTNVHVVIEQAPHAAIAEEAASARWSVLPLSAPSAEGLRRAADGLAAFLSTEPAPRLADVAATLARPPRAFAHRRAVPAADIGMAVRALRSAGPDSVATSDAVVFAFTGQGSQQPGLARVLHQSSPSFAAALDLCRGDLAALGCDVDACLFGHGPADTLRDQLLDTAVAQPVLFAFGYAYAEMLRAWGLEPSAVIGHSLGEFTALCVAGALDRRDALTLVVARGRAMQRLADGAMLAVAAAEATVRAALEPDCEIAALNGPVQLVVGGPVEAIGRMAERLAQDGVPIHRLASRRAFHTAMMEPALADLSRAAARLQFHPCRLPVITNATGETLSPDATPADHVVRHARSPVRFGAGIESLIAAGQRNFLEIGAGTTLTGLIRANAGGRAVVAIAGLPRAESGIDPVEQAVAAAAQAWSAGASIDWRVVDLVARGRRISLPPYPFARTRCWVAAGAAPAELRDAATPPAPPDPAPGDDLSAVCEVWRECLGHPLVSADDSYHRLGGDSLTAVRIAERLGHRCAMALNPTDLLRADTPRALAALIAERRGEAEPAGEGIVIALRRPEQDGDILVLFHAIGGTVHLYADLAAALPDRTIRMVQALPFAGPKPQPDTVEAMTSAYLAALDLGRDQAVHFAGASFGGLIAFEAARQWVAQDRRAASVIMLDSPAPGDITAAIEDEADVLAFMAQLIGRPVSAEELRRLAAGARLQRILEIAHGHLPDGVDAAAMRKFIDVFAANARAMNAYRPPSCDPAPTTLIIAETRDAGQPADPARGWGAFIRGPFSVETVPGGHLSMLEEPQVKATARAVERAIARAHGRPVHATRIAS